MQETTFRLTTHDNQEIHTYCWRPDPDCASRELIVQISHGMAEHALRYRRFAEALTSEGFTVYANDHRGHGLTAKSKEDLGYTGEDGFTSMVADMNTLSRHLKNQHPEMKLVVFGHSMGSFLTRLYMAKHAKGVDGVVLCGSNGAKEPLIGVGVFLAKREVRRFGERKRSTFLNNLLFGGYNKRFKPERTPSDWLSRDEQEVQKYIDDEYCGNVHTASFFRDMFEAVKMTGRPCVWESTPKDLPVLIISGSHDPLGKFGKGALRLYQLFLSYGFQDVTCKIYPEARHELLNEINRDEVTQDVVRWLLTRSAK